jgi:Putative MetA-pathway of phenol degradation
MAAYFYQSFAGYKARRMKKAVLLTLLLLPGAALAVAPLVVDDADTVDFGHLQFNSGLQFSRTASVNSYGYLVSPVLGIASRGEFGATFGYQWQNGDGDGTDGISDLILETKWRLVGTATNLFKLSMRFDLKLPTASGQFGPGTDETDTDIFLIATRNWGNTYLDWNIGYTAVDVAQGNFKGDRWFLGQAVRHQLNSHWNLIGDAYVTFSQGATGTPANFNFEGGVQYNLRENFLLSVLAGSAVGSDSSDLTGYVGFTWTF